MIKVREVTSDDYAAVLAFLHGWRDIDFAPPEVWREMIGRVMDRQFHLSWGGAPVRPGYGLYDGDRLVGYLGTLHSRRWMPDGTERSFVAITPWFVLPPYRALSMQLLLPVLRQQDTAVVGAAPSEAVGVLVRRLGFRPMREGVQLVMITSLPPGTPPAPGLTTRPAEIQERLERGQARICADYRRLPEMQHLLYQQGERSCYVVAGLQPQLRGVRTYYVSDPALFVEHAPLLVGALFDAARERTGHFFSFLTVEHRLLGDQRLSLGISTDASQLGYHTAVFRPADADPSAPVPTDSLYTDVSLLD